MHHDEKPLLATDEDEEIVTSHSIELIDTNYEGPIETAKSELLPYTEFVAIHSSKGSQDV